MAQMNVVEQGDIVAASYAPEAELRDALTEAQAETPKVESETPAPQSEPSAPAEPESKDAIRNEKGQFVKPPKKDSIQARIDKATFEREEAKREAAAARAELEQLRARPPEPIRQPEAPRQEPAKPTTEPPDWYKSIDTYLAANPGKAYEDWMDERATWRSERVYETRHQQWLQSLEQQRQVAEEFNTQQTHQSRIQQARTRYPDWDEVGQRTIAAIQAAGVPMLPPVIERAILQSEHGAAILHDYFGAHPEELVQLVTDNLQTPVTAAPLMRKYLESKVTTGVANGSGPAPVVRQSRAASPPKPVGSSPSAADVSLEELPYDGPGGFAEQFAAKHFRRRR